MNTAGRRQKQAKNNYRHIHAKARPNYNKTDPDIAKRRLEVVVARERERQSRKKK